MPLLHFFALIQSVQCLTNFHYFHLLNEFIKLAGINKGYEELVIQLKENIFKLWLA